MKRVLKNNLFTTTEVVSISKKMEVFRTSSHYSVSPFSSFLALSLSPLVSNQIELLHSLLFHHPRIYPLNYLKRLKKSFALSLDSSPSLLFLGFFLFRCLNIKGPAFISLLIHYLNSLSLTDENPITVIKNSDFLSFRTGRERVDSDSLPTLTRSTSNLFRFDNCI